MRWRDVGIAAVVGVVLGVPVAFGAFGRATLVDGVMPAYAYWYIPALAIVVAQLPMWRVPGCRIGPVVRVLGMIAVAWLALLVAVAAVYLIVFPLVSQRP